MKYTIKTTQKVEMAQPKPTMELWLEQAGDGVKLIGIDGRGYTWYILSLPPSGTLIRTGCIGLDSGLSLDSHNRIKLEGE